MRWRRALAIGAVVAAVLGGAVVLQRNAPEGPAVLVRSAAFPTALVALPDGGLLYAERQGRVRLVDADGRLQDRPVAEVDTESGRDQRGLLGLARDDDGRLFATWTRASDGRLVVGQVAPGRQRLVWEGPASARLANGGRLAVDDDGDLVLGVGDLTAPELVEDPAAPNGKLLVLDPARDPGQRPRVLSAGWNNPYAFAFTPTGDLWVADNAPPGRAERLARGDVGGRPTSATEIEAQAPSGLVVLGEQRLGICGFLTGELRVYDIGDPPAEERRDARTEPCTLGAAVLADGRVALATEDRISVVERPG